MSTPEVITHMKQGLIAFQFMTLGIDTVDGHSLSNETCGESLLWCHSKNFGYVRLLVKSLINEVPYMAKLSSGKTFAVGIENENSRENFCGSSFFYENVYC